MSKVCAEPIVPANGEVTNILGVVGASVTIRCNTGFVPQQPIIAICQENGNWTPNPADHQCFGMYVVGTCDHDNYFV